MKRIETLTRSDRLDVVRTLNDAALNGDVLYSCRFEGATECSACPLANECGALFISEFPKKSFVGWLNWLCGDVYAFKIDSGYRVLLTDRINHYRIARPDGVDIYAVGQPLPLLPRAREGNPALAITDVFASRYGAVCILVEDTYSGEKWLYSDIL